ncbi:aa3-type cytochrome oxidase subunit CtaJ [Actinokineospora bangkokensis]|uniref:Uncharacterized protein n=1 Tax=Actinokineospora bangkokensis TaxID=1193682 RepID=A0A1Q9LC23_9PSEU|nr:hypothetical protein [Actinokineospora bangkokensis]OLR89570.1 hypothetical protein BJP25_05730 [Actinokineospora bangkokensis]
MTPVETVLVFAVIPLALYGVITLVTLRDKFAKSPRYRPGQQWTHDPVWWSANPAGLGSAHPAAHAAPGADAETTRTAKGGARGNW